MNIETLSATEIGRRIAARELSSREVTAYFLQRSQRLNASINAYTHLDAETAMEVARRFDAAGNGAPARSPLAGVPVAIKDVLCQTDVPTTCGSRMLDNFRPPYTATAVQRLVDGGLIPIGKTNMDEFAMGASTETSAAGLTRNPWGTDRTPGGSSGGAAAALAGGMVPLSIGTDTGGSVRQPAAFCGVCGMKPTYGRVSRYGLVAFASSLDQVGPMAHHVEDVAALMELLAGHDPLDSTSLDETAPRYTSELNNPLSGLRIGVLREAIEHPALAPEIRTAVQAATEQLEALGCQLVDVQLPTAGYSVPAYYVIAPCEASSNLARYEGVHYGHRAELQAAPDDDDSPLERMMVASRSRGFGDEVKRRIMLGTFALSAGYYDAYYKKALQVRRLIADDYRRAFENVDVLLGPTSPTTAFRLEVKTDDPVQMYLCDLFTVGANLAGIPGLSIPAGFDDERLPLAVQLQGPALQEARLLNVAYQLQREGLFAPSIAPVHK